MINYDLTKIKMLAFDVDGVLSRQTVGLGTDGQPQRTVNIQDGYALQLAVKRGLHIAIITGAKTKETAIRYQNLGIEDIHLGCQVKIGIYQKILQQQDLKNEEVLYMGDDIPDWEIMQQVGLPCCPADAAIEIKEISRYISPHKGGDGCVRDVIEQILRAHDLWMTDKTAFGW